MTHPGRLLATVLMITNFADVAALVLITNALVRWLGGWGYAAGGAIISATTSIEPVASNAPTAVTDTSVINR